MSADARSAAARPRPRAARDARAGATRRCAARALGEVEVVEDAYVLCDGGRDRGRRAHARPAAARRARSRSSTAAGCARSPGSSTATRMRASPATASRSSRCARRGASYEELHAAGGGILSTVRATRAAGEDGARGRPCERAPRLDARARARRRSRRSRATGSTATPSSRRCGRSGPRAASRPGSARTPCRPSTTTPTRTSTSLLAEVLPEAAELAEAADVFLERGAFDVDAGAPLPRGVPRRGARAPAPRRPVHRAGRGPARDRARRALGRPPRGDRARTASRALAASDVVGVLLPASALFLGRPMPPARALVDAGAAVALATDFNPGSAFCESLPLVCSLACTQLRLSPAEALARLHGQRRARARPRRPDRTARARLRRRPRPARRARLALPRVPPRRRGRRAVVVEAARSRGRARHKLGPCRPASSAAGATKSAATSTRYVYVDDEGNEVPVEPTERRERKDGSAGPARGGRRSAPVVEQVGKRAHLRPAHVHHDQVLNGNSSAAVSQVLLCSLPAVQLLDGHVRLPIYRGARAQELGSRLAAVVALPGHGARSSSRRLGVETRAARRDRRRQRPDRPSSVSPPTRSAPSVHDDENACSLTWCSPVLAGLSPIRTRGPRRSEDDWRSAPAGVSIGSAGSDSASDRGRARG